MKLADLAASNLQLTQTTLAADPELVRDIQAHLGIQVDGIWGWQTDNAIASFCSTVHLNNATTMVFGKTFALKLLERDFSGDAIIDYEGIAQTLNCSLLNLKTHLPAIIAALKQQGIYSKLTLVAAIATVGVETPDFAPIREIGSRAYFEKMYGGRADLNNCKPGDGALYCGRGHIQLTGRANYRTYGTRLGIDLENNPNLALQPDVSASILALYFKDRKIDMLANQGKWRAVRKAVNGGFNAWDEFITLVNKITKIINF